MTFSDIKDYGQALKFCDIQYMEGLRVENDEECVEYRRVQRALALSRRVGRSLKW